MGYSSAMIRKVLFVDDDQILRTAIEQRLSRQSDSFGLVTAVDGFDAVGKLKEHPVSLVVLDLVMPRMDGMSLIEHLSNTTRIYPLLWLPVSGMKRWPRWLAAAQLLAISTSRFRPMSWSP